MGVSVILNLVPSRPYTDCSGRTIKNFASFPIEIAAGQIVEIKAMPFEDSAWFELLQNSKCSQL